METVKNVLSRWGKKVGEKAKAAEALSRDTWQHCKYHKYLDDFSYKEFDFLFVDSFLNTFLLLKQRVLFDKMSLGKLAVICKMMDLFLTSIACLMLFLIKRRCWCHQPNSS